MWGVKGEGVWEVKVWEMRGCEKRRVRRTQFEKPNSNKYITLSDGV